MSAARAIPIALLVVLFALALAEPALAHDCSSPRDCEQTAGYNAVIALAGGLLALAAGLFGNAVAGGSEAPAAAGAESAPVRRRKGCCLSWFTMIASIPVAALILLLRAVGVV